MRFGCNARSIVVLLAAAIISLLLVFVLARSSKASPTPVVSWESLDAKLAAAGGTSVSAKEFSSVPEYLSLLDANDQAVFNEMVQQGRFPFVAAAGVAAIERSDAEAAYAAAMRAMANAENPSFAWGMIILYLQKAKVPSEKVFIAQFEQLCGEYSRQRGGMVVLVEALPIERLVTWLQSKPQFRSASRESIVLARVYAEYKNKAKGLPEWLTKKLASYRGIPGSPRATFVYYQDLAESDLKELIPEVLEDKTLEDSEVMAVVSRHKAYISREIDVKALKIDAKRMDLVDRILRPRK